MTAELCMKSIVLLLTAANFSQSDSGMWRRSLITNVTLICTVSESTSNVFNCVVEMVKLVPGISTVKKLDAWMAPRADIKKGLRISDIAARQVVVGAGAGYARSGKIWSSLSVGRMERSPK